MYKKTIILAAAAVLTVTVMTSMMAGQVFAQTFLGGNGGIGGAGGAGGVAGNGGANTFSGSQTSAISGTHNGNSNHQSANGGDANGGRGGSANGGNVCALAFCRS